MPLRVAINGFGRIGRAFFRAAQGNQKLEIVAINDLVTPKQITYLLKYDSVLGRFKGVVEERDYNLVANGKVVTLLRNDNPAELPWKAMEIDAVVESTGFFTSGERASRHLRAGARKVLITAPAKEPDVTIVPGVNTELYDRDRHNIISMASCTTNCLAPVAKILNEEFGIVKGFATTVHAYTNDQVLLDFQHRDLRRGRSAAMNIIPTTTGAAKAIGDVIPELKGKLDGLALRVPVPDVSLVDLSVLVGKVASTEEVNRVLRSSSERNLKGIMEYVEEPVVSQDILGNPASSIIDGLSTCVVDKDMVKVLSWYDNEWGYSNRLVDLLADVIGGVGNGQNPTVQ